MSKFNEANVDKNILAELLELKTKVRDLELKKVNDGISQAFPVGSIFISVVSTNPNTLLGYGVWAAFGSGRTLVGLDVGQTEFDTVEETGGAKTHTLTVGEMPSHTHSFTPLYNGPHTAGYSNISMSGTAMADNAVGSTGGDGAHNNLQPYIVVYMWKRTS